MKRVLLLAVGVVMFAGLAVEVRSEEKPAADPALELYYNANGLYNRKLYPLSVEQYQVFLAKYRNHPKAPMAELGLALSLFMAGDIEKAEPLLAKLCNRNDLPNRDQVKLMYGQALLKLGRPEQAAPILGQVVAAAGSAPHRQQALAAWIEALYQAKSWKDLVPRAEELLKAAPNGPLPERVRYQLGLAHFNLEAYQKATETLLPFARGLESSPYRHQAFFLLAESYRLGGNLDEAAKAYVRAAEDADQPTAADALFLLGYTQAERKAYDEAIQALKTFTDKHPQHASYPRGLVLLGRSYLEKSRVQEAGSTLEKALGLSGVEAEAALWLGRTRLQEKQPDRAVQAFTRGISKANGQPALAALLFELGNVSLERGQYAEAAANYGRFIQTFPEHPQRADAQRQRAYSLHRAGSYKDALAQCVAFLKEYPTHETAPEVAFLLAESQVLAGEREQAVQAFKTLISTYPASSRTDAARFRAGQLLYELGKWAEAAGMLDPLLGKALKDPLFVQLGYLAGACSFNLEQWPLARERLEKFASEHPQEEHADLALMTAATAALKADDTDRALGLLKHFPNAFPKSLLLPRALSETGRLLYEKQQYEVARSTLQRVLTTKDAGTYAADALYYLGWVELGAGKPAEAAVHFAAMADKHPVDERAADARRQQGLALIKIEKYPEAEAAFLALLKAFPGDQQVDLARFQLGLALARQEKWAPALEAFGKVTRESEYHPQALYESAWCAKVLNQPDQAAAYYNTLSSAYPKHELALSALFELAELEYGRQQYPQAAGRLEKVLTSGPKGDLLERALFRLGWCYFDQEDHLKAAPAFERLLREAAQSELALPARFQAGESRLKLKEYPAARVHFEQAVAEERKTRVTEPSLLRLGETLGLTGAWPASETACDEFVRTFPQSEFLSRARFGLGWARENQKKYPEAIAAYSLVVQAGVKNETAARCRFQIGECHLALKQYDEAIKAFMDVEVNYAYPQYASKALLEMGVSLERKGDPEAALECYREIVQKYPTSEAADVARQTLKQQAQ